MIKNLILLIAVIACFSCNNDNNNGFKGKWVNVDNDERIIVISRIGENYTVNINDKEKYPAIESNGILKIIIENDTVNGKIDNENHLILKNESFKKLNGKYSNPGAGIY